MELITDYITPAELTGFNRLFMQNQVLNDAQNSFLNRFFANEYIDDVEYTFALGGELQSGVASYRAYDAESPIGSRPGQSSKKGTIPPISEKILLSEYENLRRRQSNRAAIRNVTMEDAKRQAQRIAGRLEVARGQALAEGKVEIIENGLVTQIEFDRDPNHTTTASSDWGTPGSGDPLFDLTTWRDMIEDKGFTVETILASRAVVSAARRCEAVIDAIKGSAVAVTQVTLDDLNALLVSEGLPPFTVYNGKVRGIETIGRDSVVLLGDDSIVGRTVWGTTAEALESAYEVNLDNGEGPGIVSGQYKDNDPVVLWTKTASIAVPLFAEPNATLAATVLA